MSTPIIEIRDAVVAYRSGVALDGVSLAVNAGEAVGILGPNGTGKSTLLLLVNGLVRPQSGWVRVLGGVPFRAMQGYRLRRRIGYLAQTQRIDPRLPVTVRETVAAGRYGRIGLLRRMGRADRLAVAEAMDRMGVAHLAARPLGHLSGGELQRTALARALAQEPEILLLDEPTASVDPGARGALLAHVDALPALTGAAMLYVTHETGAVPGGCARLALMRAGRVWRDGPRAEMLAVDTLRALYGEEDL